MNTKAKTMRLLAGLSLGLAAGAAPAAWTAEGIGISSSYSIAVSQGYAEAVEACDSVNGTADPNYWVAESVKYPTYWWVVVHTACY